MYVVVPHQWPNEAAFFVQLKRFDDGIVTTVFQCRHRHRTLEEATTCPDMIEARKAEQSRGAV
jgi:hypothetical protein